MRKTSRRGREPTTNSYHFIYLKHEKSTPFSRSLPIKAIIGSTVTPLPGGREASVLTTAPLLLSFQRQKPIHLLYLFFLLYLHKKGSSSLSTSLIHNKYFAKFVPVYFLIQMSPWVYCLPSAVNARDSKYLDFPLNDCRLKCSYEFIPRRFGPKIRYKDLVRLRKTKRV